MTNAKRFTEVNEQLKEKVLKSNRFWTDNPYEMGVIPPVEEMGKIFSKGEKK